MVTCFAYLFRLQHQTKCIVIIHTHFTYNWNKWTRYMLHRFFFFWNINRKHKLLMFNCYFRTTLLNYNTLLYREKNVSRVITCVYAILIYIGRRRAVNMEKEKWTFKMFLLRRVKRKNEYASDENNIYIYIYIEKMCQLCVLPRKWQNMKKMQSLQNHYVIK